MKSSFLSAAFCCFVTVFGHPVQASSLPNIVELAVQTHPQLIQSDRKVREGEQIVEQAKGGYLPSVDITADWGYEVVDTPSTRASQTDDETWNNGRIGFEARQMLFDGQATSNDVRRTEAFTQAREYERQGMTQSIALAASQVYLDVLRHRQHYELSKINLENHRVIYQQISSRVERGVGTKADQSQIESRLNNAESNVIAAQNNLLDAEASYQQVIGELAPHQLQPFSFNAAMLPRSLADAEEQVRLGNPIVLASRADIKEAESRYDYSKSSYYPEVDLVLFGDYGEDLDGTNGSNKNYGAMVQMRWNIFRGGSDKASERASAFVVEQARAINSNTHRDARQRLKLSWSAFQMLERQEKFLAQYAAASERTRDSYKKEFNLGKRTLLDLLDSENELFGAQNQHLDARIDYELSKARILEAVGELYQQLTSAQ
ncbi:TolC family outer membrane protein [Echinimonas agarilytica]|uniref:TolC family outer membrane protein n=1 Tax=Echinimonas agarilytica TaxID=1215918 RepID=A0AA41W889_9GAMM|nr:TolC family outer membrane protein [Echinimonas agarilytica]MCM2680327.1 TolC family outer membrane protein [Echinimonas agarilytica]